MLINDKKINVIEVKISPLMNDLAFFGPNRYNCKDCILTLPIRLHFQMKKRKDRIQ